MFDLGTSYLLFFVYSVVWVVGYFVWATWFQPAEPGETRRGRR